MLSELLCRVLDNSMESVARGTGFTYTRYADDLTFSSSRSHLAAREIGRLRLQVTDVLTRFGLRENKAKFSVAGPGARRVVLGLLVDGDRPRLSRATRARVEGHLHYLLRHGPAKHAARRGFRSIDALREHLRGLLAYVKQVDETLYQQYVSEASTIIWPPD